MRDWQCKNSSMPPTNATLLLRSWESLANLKTQSSIPSPLVAYRLRPHLKPFARNKSEPWLVRTLSSFLPYQNLPLIPSSQPSRHQAIPRSHPRPSGLVRCRLCPDLKARWSLGAPIDIWATPSAAHRRRSPSLQRLHAPAQQTTSLSPLGVSLPCSSSATTMVPMTV